MEQNHPLSIKAGVGQRENQESGLEYKSKKWLWNEEVDNSEVI